MSEELDEFAVEVADQIESFLIALGAVARGDLEDGALSILLLEVSQLLLAGARLGAIVDIVPDDRFEPDVGMDPDADGPEIVPSRLSDDLTDVAADLVHGLQHFRGGRRVEGLWWWQYSYLANWGSTASSALRALHSAVAHTRLDVEPAG